MMPETLGLLLDHLARHIIEYVVMDERFVTRHFRSVTSR